jgi:DNA-binding NtrC family response regulator
VHKGATFEIYLPCAADAAEESPNAIAPSPASGTETVVLVEDERAVRNLSRLILERAGYRVFVAENREEAAAIFRQHGNVVDLLVTDVVMPASCGPLLYEELKAHQPSLRVLYMSGYTDPTVVQEGRLDPGVGFLQKPFTGDTFARKVREVLDR